MSPASFLQGYTSSAWFSIFFPGFPAVFFRDFVLLTFIPWGKRGNSDRRETRRCIHAVRQTQTTGEDSRPNLLRQEGARPAGGFGAARKAAPRRGLDRAVVSPRPAGPAR